MPVMTQPSNPTRAHKHDEANRVFRALDEMCRVLQAGDTIPTHKELMRRFDASERVVLRALEEMQRQGKIIRRPRIGTVVAGGRRDTPASAMGRRTVMAVSQPDQSYFDRAMSLLFDHVETADLKLACQFINPVVDTIAVPAEGEQPLGYIFFRGNMAPLAKRLQDAGCRVVLVGTPPLDVTFEVPNVYGDHAHGGYLATKHLLDLGHRRIAFCGDADLKETRRWRGHERALREVQKAGEETQTDIIYFPEVARWKQNPALAREYFTRAAAPTAIVEWNDHEAVAMIGVLSRAGLRVPEDVSVIGYDDMPEGRIIHPALTTVDSAIQQQLDAALNLLTRPVAPSSHTMVIMPALVSRESTAPRRTA
jgi:hypothetical protein